MKFNVTFLHNNYTSRFVLVLPEWSCQMTIARAFYIMNVLRTNINAVSTTCA